MPDLSGRVSRRDIALSPAVWILVWGTFGIFAIGSALMALFGGPDLQPGRLTALSAGLAIIAVVLARMPPPEPDHPRTHVLLALTYVVPMLAMVAFAPQGAAVAITAAFAGPLTSVWIVDRRQIAGHLIAATVVLFLPSALGLVDQATFVACLLTAPTIWALATTCAIVLEHAERQGAELAHLGRRDPLTGAGNRRLLDEALEAELRDYAETQRPCSILTFDLNGFKALNDTVGHAAGDALLRATAGVLMRTARSQDVVVRQGGDEFCIVLPGTSERNARVLAELIRARLQAVQAYGSGISTGIGLATCPQDGTDADHLLSTADHRLLADKAATANEPATWHREVPETAGRPSHAPHADAAPAWTIEGVSRRELAGLRATWRLAMVSGVMYAVFGLGLLVFTPSLTRDGLEYAIVGALVMVAGFAFTHPPAIGTVRNHLYVAMPWCLPASFAVFTRPGAIALGVSMFVGPLAAVRLVDRRQIVGHLTLATVVFAALLVARANELPTVVSLAIVISNLWVLGFACVVVLEASERQGGELAILVRRDPLTQLGNRRRLRERLAAELGSHAAAGQSLTVITLDLNGFKHLNDTAGHAAGDAVLQRVADALRMIAAHPSEAMRQGGDEFAVILPDTTAEEARATTAAISRSLGSIVEQGVRVTTGIGTATFPQDGDTVDALLDLADHRLRTDKYGATASSGPLAALERELRAEQRPRAADHD